MRVVLVVILVLLVIGWGTVLFWGKECFSFARSRLVAADGRRLVSFNDAYLVAGTTGPGAVLSLDGTGSIRLLPKGLYAGFRKTVLSRAFYAVALSAAKPKEPWITQPAGGDTYFFSQRVNGRPVYLFLSEGVLTGDPVNKTALRLEPA